MCLNLLNIGSTDFFPISLMSSRAYSGAFGTGGSHVDLHVVHFYWRNMDLKNVGEVG